MKIKHVILSALIGAFAFVTPSFAKHECAKCECSCHSEHKKSSVKNSDKKESECQKCKEHHKNDQACSPKNHSDLNVKSTFIRPTADVGASTAAYLTIENNTKDDDTLVAVTSDIASNIQIHKSNIDAKGVMTMLPVTEGITIPAGQKVIFQPKGTHIMLTGTTKKLNAGDTITLSLNFKKAGVKSISFPVATQAENASMKKMDAHHAHH